VGNNQNTEASALHKGIFPRGAAISRRFTLIMAQTPAWCGPACIGIVSIMRTMLTPG
jgi:hypothetical protein